MHFVKREVDSDRFRMDKAFVWHAVLLVVAIMTVASFAAGQSPKITSISKVFAQQFQTITITGTGFGTMDPYQGDSNFISFGDGTGGWEAGYAPDGNVQGLIVNSWTDTQIVLGGFTLDATQWLPRVGDKFSISVWNAQTGSGPSGKRGKVKAVTHDFWTSGAPLPTAVWCPMVGVLNGKIYVVAGTNSNGDAIGDTQVYNPVADSWSSAAPLPVTNCAGVAATVKGTLYVIGGYPYTGAVWAYNPQTDTWSSKAPMPTARTDMGVAVLQNIIYVIGGNTSTQNRVNTVESYNPASDTWTEETPLLVGKSEPSVGLAGTKALGFTILATDGYSADGDDGDNEGYNPGTGAWNSLSLDPTPRNAACAGTIGTRMYVAGGYPGFGTALSSNESYNLASDSWLTLAAMPQGVLFSGSAVYKGRLYCIGGSESFATNVLDSVQIYRP